MADKLVCELPKNAREMIRFRLAEFKGHRFIDIRVFIREDGKDGWLRIWNPRSKAFVARTWRPGL